MPWGLYSLREDEVDWPSLAIVIGGSGWGSIRPNLPANDRWIVTNDPRAWWHPLGFTHKKTAIVFVDGHAAYTQVEILVPNTDHYRLNP